MIENIFIFENRKLPFLNSYVNKATSLGFAPTILSNGQLDGDPKFKHFKEIYQHLSVGNTVEFEVSCIARYFALANVVTNDDTFILSDSDIFLTSNLKNLKSDSTIKGSFVGSEGFLESGSENQISPHFSIWNRELLNDFVDFIIFIYNKNIEDQCLTHIFEKQKSLLGITSISDMTLLYLWINERNIPFINSNSIANNWGIDHNISSLICEDGNYRSELNRKKIVFKDDKLLFETTDGQLKEMSIVHFQGGYKQILYDFYMGRISKFALFSAYINLGRKVMAIKRSLNF